MTQAVAYSNFRANLKTYMRRVNEDADTLLVTNADPEDNVVVMSADDYDSLMETLRVYQNPYLSDKVMRGMAQVRQGQTPTTCTGRLRTAGPSSASTRSSGICSVPRSRASASPNPSNGACPAHGRGASTQPTVSSIPSPTTGSASSPRRTTTE